MKRTRFGAQIVLTLENSRIADALYRALIPETLSLPRYERAEVFVSKLEERKILIEIKALDISALRAVMNSFLYLVHSCISVLLSHCPEKCLKSVIKKAYRG